MKKISKAETEKVIKEFFNGIENRTSKDIKKIKKLAMNKNIPLKELRKEFCKKCFAPYKNPKIRIRNKIKSVICGNCGDISRYKLN